MIEELLHKKSSFDFTAFKDRFQEINHEYNQLIKKYKILNKEKVQMQKYVDELVKDNQMLENDFKILFK